MRAIIHQDVFASAGTGSLALLELLALARGERHAIVTDPPYDPALATQPVHRWLDALPPGARQECMQILEQSIALNASLPAGVSTIRVISSAASDWKRGHLRIDDATWLLRTPLRLVLESRNADFHFLLRLAPPTLRRELKDALARGWIEVVHGGGLPAMMALLQELATAPDHDVSAHVYRLRLWLMFDRDSHVDDRSQPSPDSDTLKSLCQEESIQQPWPLTFHQLGRRTIESYLPERVLQYWVGDGKGSEKTTRRVMVEALAELAPRARWQYNMKEGLVRDLPRRLRDTIEEQRRDVQDHELDPLFRGLSQRARRALARGFGKDIARLFDAPRPVDDESWEHWFREEYARGPAGQPTRETLLHSLFARR